MVEVNAYLNNKVIDIREFKPKPSDIATLIRLIDDGSISGKIAKDVFVDMCETGDSPEAIVASKGLKQVSDEGELVSIIEKVLTDNQKVVDEYKSGKEKSFGFLVVHLLTATKVMSTSEKD